MSADENNFATTIPVGPLGIIALNSCEPIGKKSMLIFQHGEMTENTSTRTQSLFQVIRKILILLIQRFRDLVQVRQRVVLTNLSEVKIYTLW